MPLDSTDDNNSEESNRTVIVSNLPTDYDESCVRTLFANVGTVLNCSLNFDSNKKYLNSIVEFSSTDEAEAAIKLSGVSVRYHILKIEKYKVLDNNKEKEIESDTLNTEKVNLIDVQDKLAKVLEARDKILNKIKSKEQDDSYKRSRRNKERSSRWDVEKPIIKKTQLLR